MIDEIIINERFSKHVRSVPDVPYDLENDSVPVISKSLYNTKDFLTKINDYVKGDTEILPANCRYFETISPGKTLFVIEEPPAFRTISASFPLNKELEKLESQDKIKEWNIDHKYYSNIENAPYKFTLAFPYVIFIFVVDKNQQYRTLSGQVFLRNARMASIHDYLLKMPMMNISHDQMICFGDSIRRPHDNNQQSIENAIMTFWSAPFNMDYLYNYDAYKNVAGVDTYIGWHTLSKIDPMFIYFVKWIKHSETIKNILTDNRIRYKSDQSKVSYSNLISLFTSPADTKKEVSSAFIPGKKINLYSDVLNGMYIKGRNFMHVGDTFMLGNKKVTVDSFMGRLQGDVTHLKCQLENGKQIYVKLSHDLLNIIDDSLQAQKFQTSAILPNGEIIKEGTLLEVKLNDKNLFYKVNYIRKVKDGTTEVQMGNSFFILENLNAKILDIENQSFGDFQLNYDDLYMYSRNNYLFHSTGSFVKFKSYDVDNTMGSIKLVFEEVDFTGNASTGETYQFPANSGLPRTAHGASKLTKFADLTQLPEFFHLQRRIYSQESLHPDYPLDRAFKGKHSIYNSYNLNKCPSIRAIYNNTVVNDGTCFHIEGIYKDTSFCVGDKVVVADWTDPLEVLKIKEIQAFVLDTESEAIKFILVDKHNKITQVPYIKKTPDGGSYSMIIDIGKIRRVVTSHNGISAGTKIIATAGKISNFPKKDVNIIVGFIIDIDEPLVLCSNGCTLWFSDMMANFKRIPITSTKWKTLQHAPLDISKITFQPGDRVKRPERSGQSYMVMRYDHQKAARILPESRTNDTYPLNDQMKSSLIFDCIPNPRLSKAVQDQKRSVPAFTDDYGKFYKTDLTNHAFYFLEDERSLVNV